MYKKLSKSDQQTVGIDLWYYNGINQNPAIIFATGRHGNKNNDIGKPYIIYSLNSLHKQYIILLKESRHADNFDYCSGKGLKIFLVY